MGLETKSKLYRRYGMGERLPAEDTITNQIKSNPPRQEFQVVRKDKISESKSKSKNTPTKEARRGEEKTHGISVPKER
jgi:hypothetical protein